MLTTNGIRVQPEIEALQEGEGFLIKVTTSWRVVEGNRDAIAQAKDQGLIGEIHNGHEASFGEALTKLKAVCDQFATDITNFIDNYNANN